MQLVQVTKRLGKPWKFIIYGFLGWCVEVVFTSVAAQVEGNGDLRLQGHSYLWMHPIWGLGLLVCAECGSWLREKRIPFWARIVFYAMISFAVEYSSGWLLRHTLGQCPWDYSNAAWNIHGLIRLDYAPFWGVGGLLAERISLFLRRVEIRVDVPSLGMKSSQAD